MKVIYVAHSMTDYKGNLNGLEALLSWLIKNNYKVIRPVYALFSEFLVKQALQSIKGADIIIADITNQSHGVGFEIGYAYALEKEIVTIASDTSREKISRFILGLFPDTIFYENNDDLLSKISKRLTIIRA